MIGRDRRSDLPRRRTGSCSTTQAAGGAGKLAARLLRRQQLGHARWQPGREPRGSRRRSRTTCARPSCWPVPLIVAALVLPLPRLRRQPARPARRRDHDPRQLLRPPQSLPRLPRLDLRAQPRHRPLARALDRLEPALALRYREERARTDDLRLALRQRASACRTHDRLQCAHGRGLTCLPARLPASLPRAR